MPDVSQPDFAARFSAAWAYLCSRGCSLCIGSLRWPIWMSLLLVLNASQAIATPEEQAVSAGPVPTVAEIADRIAASNARILHVELWNSRSTLETSSSDRGPWAPQPERAIASYILIDGKPDGRFRVHFDSYVAPWSGGRAPWADVREEHGWNGREMREVSFTQRDFGGGRDTVMESMGATIGPNRVEPFGATGEMAYHRHLVANFMGKLYLGPLDQTLRTVVEARHPATVSWDDSTIPGSRLLRIDFNTRGKRPTFWVEPSKGYMLRKFDVGRLASSDTGKVTMAREGEVTEVVEAAPGIWYPTKSWLISDGFGALPDGRLADRGWIGRLTATTERVVINNPKINDDSWLPEIPPMFGVTDHSRGELWRKAPDGKVYAEKLDQRVGEARAKYYSALATQPTGTTGRGQLEPGSAMVADSAPSGLSAWQLAAVGGAVALAVLLVARLAARLRRGGRGDRGGRPNGGTAAAAILIGAWTFPAAFPCTTAVAHAEIQPATRPVSAVAFTEVPGGGGGPGVGAVPMSRLNCGLEAAYLLLRWEGRNVALTDVAAALNVGDDLSRLASFADLSRYLAGHGLETRAVRADSPEKAVAAVKAPAVLRLKRLISGTDIGHYVLVIPDGDGLLILDGLYPVRRVARSDAPRDRDLGKASGEVLMVRPIPQDRRNSARSTFPVREVSLGELPFSSGDVRVAVRVANRSDRELRVSGRTTCCSCFRAIEGDGVVPARSERELVVLLRRDRLSVGENARKIELETNDRDVPAVTVTARFTLAAGGSTRTPRLVPSELDFGRRTPARLAAQRVLLELPGESLPAGTRPTVAVIQEPGAPWSVTVGEPERRETRGVLRESAVTWRVPLEINYTGSMTPGDANHRVRLKVEGLSQPLELPVSVQWVAP